MQGHRNPIVVEGVVLPHTPLAREVQCTWYDPKTTPTFGGKCEEDPKGDRGVSVIDINGIEVIRLFKGALRPPKVEILQQAGEKFYKAVAPKCYATDRGQMAVKHLAFWRKSKLKTYVRYIIAVIVLFGMFC